MNSDERLADERLYLRNWNWDGKWEEDLFASVEKKRRHDGILHYLLLACLDSSLLLADESEQKH